jgi:hypothetical protein
MFSLFVDEFVAVHVKLVPFQTMLQQAAGRVKVIHTSMTKKTWCANLAQEIFSHLCTGTLASPWTF